MTVINFVRALAGHRKRHLRLTTPDKTLPAAATFTVHCRHLVPGCEDWDRGIYKIGWQRDYRAWIDRQSGDAIDVLGLPCGRLSIDAISLARALIRGFRARSGSFEIEIAAMDLRAALRSSGGDNILVFSRRDH